ncbi:MAG: ethanolamine utilization protein EutJ [Deltaproteobacteria bacterium]|jgi:ethanolamine utilization protein EutJ|nr:ethanolamine utilization protein EutJ [Deltaproteobacteria bacterium]
MDDPGPAPPPAGLEPFLDALQGRLERPLPPADGQEIRVGLDLGTSSIVLVVLAGDGSPLAMARSAASVVKDGLVVDFNGARLICGRLRLGLETALGLSLDRAAIAVPPGTSERDQATHRYVCEAAGLEVCGVFDEPVAANLLLGIRDGALADLGGGTTGAAAFRDGRMVASFDEATGGHHLSLVIAGHERMPLEKAEAFKIDPANAKAVAAMVAPVLAKMGRILSSGLAGLDVGVLHLAGGSAAAPGAGPVIAQETGLRVLVAPRPDLVTPAGIAMGCRPFRPGPLGG